jgi:hypothetical protein
MNVNCFSGFTSPELLVYQEHGTWAVKTEQIFRWTAETVYFYSPSSQFLLGSQYWNKGTVPQDQDPAEILHSELCTCYKLFDVGFGKTVARY